MLWTGFKPTSEELYLRQGAVIQDALPTEQLWPRLAVKSLALWPIKRASAFGKKVPWLNPRGTQMFFLCWPNYGKV